MNREYLAELDKIISQFHTSDEGYYRFHPTENEYSLALLQSAIQLYTTVDHLGIQSALRNICFAFELDYDLPAGWYLKGVGSFSFKIDGQRVEAALEYVRYNPDEASVLARDKKDYVIELANFAERAYLCQQLAGINVNMPVHRNRRENFVLSFDGSELKMDVVSI